MTPRATNFAEDRQMKEFQGKVAVVTGAASGIGFAMADRFAGEGMKVVMADIEPEALSIAEEDLRRKGADVLAVQTDVTKPEQVQALADRAYEAFGATHVLCNNAGVEVIGATWEHTLDDWRWVMDVNLWGVIYGVHNWLPRMLEQGDDAHIVNTASMAGLTTAPYMAIYDVTKFGVVALSESLEKELRIADANVHISVVCPGLIDTRIMESSRNRHAERSEKGSFGANAQRFRKGLTDNLATGWPPSRVADQVFEAIRDDRFYVIPAQEGFADRIRERMENILALKNPR
jgi:NAD(P)-dependent dehydrogenase (short-subunit alcohol dehydrogenase family)